MSSSFKAFLKAATKGKEYRRKKRILRKKVMLRKDDFKKKQPGVKTLIF